MAASLQQTDRRGWLSQGLVALAISALGLAAAGSMSLTSNAQSTPLGGGPATSVPAPVTSITASPSPEPTPAVPDPSLAAFVRPDTSDQTTPTRSVRLRAAITKEQAAQRSDVLAKTAEEFTRAALTQNSEARQQDLAKAELARQTTATQLAAEQLRLAVAARVAAAASQQEGDGTVPIPAGGAGVSPVPNAVVGAHFGQRGLWSRYHTGLDFRASYGTPIKAVKAGVVLYAGNSGDWAGNHVAVKHADGVTTMYSHMSSMAARAGDTVQAGQVIGYVGQTGRAFGAHLHFEVYPAGVKYGDVYRAVNPQPWLAANGVHTR